MTPHHDLKQQEKQQWCFGGWAVCVGGGHKHFCHISVGVEYVFPTGLGGGRQNFCLPHKNVTGPTPAHLVINDFSLRTLIFVEKMNSDSMYCLFT